MTEKRIDDVLGTQTLGGRMEGVGESTELWRHPNYASIVLADPPIVAYLRVFCSNVTKIKTHRELNLNLKSWVINGPH